MAIYTAPVNMRFSGATVANSTVWALRVGATRPISIRRIVLFSAFDGAAATTSARYELLRIRTATASGGTAITPVPKLVASGASTAADVRQETTGAALTVTSITFDTALMTCGACPRGATGSVVLMNIDLSASPIVLDVNDGIVIRNQQTAVVGDVLAGFIEWEE